MIKKLRSLATKRNWSLKKDFPRDRLKVKGGLWILIVGINAAAERFSGKKTPKRPLADHGPFGWAVMS
jgi:hypothetical protein